MENNLQNINNYADCEYSKSGGLNGPSEAYLDNAAGTPICEAAAARMVEVMRICGNPSSPHAAGAAVREVIEQARSAIMRTLTSGKPAAAGDKLIFCGSGSEANNLALLGAVRAKLNGAVQPGTGRGGDGDGDGGQTAFPNRKNAVCPHIRMIISDGEHPSLENAASRLADVHDRVEIIRVSTRGGIIDKTEFSAALDANTAFVSIMAAGNETGAVYDPAPLFDEVRRIAPRALIHTDAAQMYLKFPGRQIPRGADLLTLSSHKIHGPAGVGALYIRAGAAQRIEPLFYGGDQESRLRPGTENITGIAGFGAAAEIGYANIEKNSAAVRGLGDYLRGKLAETGAVPAVPGFAVAGKTREAIPDIIREKTLIINTPAGKSLPGTVSLLLPGVMAETMVNFLSSEGVYVSAGAACSARTGKPSRALTAFGLNDCEARRVIRISLSHANTRGDVDRFIAALTGALKRLVY